MKPGFLQDKWFTRLNEEEQAHIKDLIATQKAQGDMQPLRPLPQFLQRQVPDFKKEKWATKHLGDGNDPEFWEDYDSYMVTQKSDAGGVQGKAFTLVESMLGTINQK